MKVNCEGCATEFVLDPGKVPKGGVRARCSVCNDVIVVADPGDIGRAEPVPSDLAGYRESVPAIERSPVAMEPSVSGLNQPESRESNTPTFVTPPQGREVARATPRRPINPFLTKDPDQRAKRLARALVSDIITYYPAKHSEGLREGTLKQLFKEEIKKSFEEYVDQVGREYADSTPYFQEALNDVLGAGKKIF